jgi:hypothetical protein
MHLFLNKQVLAVDHGRINMCFRENVTSYWTNMETCYILCDEKLVSVYFFKICYRVSNMVTVISLTNPSTITKKFNSVRFESFKAVFYDIVPCSRIYRYRQLGRMTCLHLPGRRLREMCCLQDRKLIFHPQNGGNMFNQNVSKDP